MADILIRTVLVYVLVVGAVRLMGKRQIGELQPTELVITIMLSEMATVPLQSKNGPLIPSIATIGLLVCLEVFSSYIALKSEKFRKITQGNAVYVIRDGVLQQDAVKRLRFSVDDIMEAIRAQGVFDISEIGYAVVETNGSLSLYLKEDKQPLTPSDIDFQTEDKGVPSVVVSDGKLVKSGFSLCGTSEEEILKRLKKKKYSLNEILIMTLDKKGNEVIIPKEKKK